jgi:hypothetical protein
VRGERRVTVGEMKALEGRIVEAARLLGSDGVDWCPDERCCANQERPDYGTGNTCMDCWVHYILTGE